MSYEHKEGQGSLFQNDKGDNPKRPDFRGTLMWKGELLDLAVWKKDGKNGWFYSMNAKPKEERAAQPKAESRPAPAPEFDDDLPF
jgi:hypothetical protein